MGLMIILPKDKKNTFAGNKYGYRLKSSLIYIYMYNVLLSILERRNGSVLMVLTKKWNL